MKTRLLFPLLALLLVCGAARAQDDSPVPDAPLVMLMNGADIWASFPAGAYPYALTGSGYNDRPVLSPDGTRIAYKVVADIGIQALRTTGGLVSELPSDMELLNLQSGAWARIATQPPDATFNQGEPARAIVRSAPTWSPDSTLLAWTEDVQPEAVRRLVVFFPATGNWQILTADLPLQAGFQQTLPVQWGSGGIAVKSTTAAPADDINRERLAETILVYNTDGALRSSAAPQPGEGEFLYDFRWINDSGVDYVALVYSTGRWERLDPATGAISALDGTPELYSLSAPDALSVGFGVTALPDRGAVFTWTALLPDGASIPLPFTGPLEWITLSPAGDAIAYADRGVAYLWQDGAATEIPGTNPVNLSAAEMVWGATAWRVRR